MGKTMSPSAMIVDRVEKRVATELNQLVKDIRRIGSGDGGVRFGALFEDELVEQYYEALAGTLRTAKKRGIVAFDGAMLLKGVHDNVVVSVVSDAAAGDGAAGDRGGDSGSAALPPPSWSSSATIADESERRVAAEMDQLVEDIRRISGNDGRDDDVDVCQSSPRSAVTFGDLFDDEKVEQFYEALVGTLSTARKRGIVAYEGTMLLKGVHDDVVISVSGRGGVVPPRDCGDASEDGGNNGNGSFPATVPPSLAATRVGGGAAADEMVETVAIATPAVAPTEEDASRLESSPFFVRRDGSAHGTKPPRVNDAVDNELTREKAEEPTAERASEDEPTGEQSADEQSMMKQQPTIEESFRRETLLTEETKLPMVDDSEGGQSTKEQSTAEGSARADASEHSPPPEALSPDGRERSADGEASDERDAAGIVAASSAPANSGPHDVGATLGEYATEPRSQDTGSGEKKVSNSNSESLPSGDDLGGGSEITIAADGTGADERAGQTKRDGQSEFPPTMPPSKVNLLGRVRDGADEDHVNGDEQLFEETGNALPARKSGRPETLIMLDEKKWMLEELLTKTEKDARLAKEARLAKKSREREVRHDSRQVLDVERRKQLDNIVIKVEDDARREGGERPDGEKRHIEMPSTQDILRNIDDRLSKLSFRGRKTEVEAEEVSRSENLENSRIAAEMCEIRNNNHPRGNKIGDGSEPVDTVLLSNAFPKAPSSICSLDAPIRSQQRWKTNMHMSMHPLTDDDSELSRRFIFDPSVTKSQMDDQIHSIVREELNEILLPGNREFGYSGSYNSEGKKHGYGIYENRSGNRYQGQWVCGKKHGLGLHTYDTGTYIGNWKENRRHGHGIMRLENGDVFEGLWFENIKQGPGSYHYSDGDVDVSFYEGDARRGDTIRWKAGRLRILELHAFKNLRTEVSISKAEQNLLSYGVGIRDIVFD